jgi:hypothetical protein
MHAHWAERAATLPDPSFRALLGELAWRRLEPAVRARFAVKPAPGGEILYRGTMAEVAATRVGRLLAQLCRLLGTPLAPHVGRDVPAEVRLRLDADGSGIVWERAYHFAQRAPVTCVSVKRAEAAGLVETVGGGIGMALALAERRGALRFRSTGFFWGWRGRRWAQPRWLSPGVMHVVHTDLGGGRFRFELGLTHALFGQIIRQHGVFVQARRAASRRRAR